MKKIIVFLLAVITAISLVACGKDPLDKAIEDSNRRLKEQSEMAHSAAQDLDTLVAAKGLVK